MLRLLPVSRAEKGGIVRERERGIHTQLMFHRTTLQHTGLGDSSNLGILAGTCRIARLTRADGDGIQEAGPLCFEKRTNHKCDVSDESLTKVNNHKQSVSGRRLF